MKTVFYKTLAGIRSVEVVEEKGFLTITNKFYFSKGIEVNRVLISKQDFLEIAEQLK